MKVRPVRCALVFCLVFSGVAATAQDTAWFEQHRKSNPDRFEGLLDRPNARSEYEVLSLLGSSSATPPRLSLDKGDFLHIRYCGPGPDADVGPVFIEVRQLTGHVNYLMKASPRWTAGWNDFLWPAKDVIWADNIDPNNLGVVIRFGQDKEFGSDIVPAVFFISPSKNAEMLSANRIQSYALTLRIQHSIQYLYYEMLASSKPVKSCYYLNEFHPCQRKKPDDDAVNAGIEEGNVITLHLDMSDVPKGPVTVRVRGRYLNSDEELSAVFHFKHENTCP
ncbi:MAG TPA: hypothetical protein VHB45_08115 [Alloacidobacterium sp.]|nr:hypothetical protein [Alloacidobacterium sp.]